MSDELTAFKHAVMVRNVVARTRQATVFPSQKALEKYLKDHPDADKSNHSVETSMGFSGLLRHLRGLGTHGAQKVEIYLHEGNRAKAKEELDKELKLWEGDDSRTGKAKVKAIKELQRHIESVFLPREKREDDPVEHRRRPEWSQPSK